MTFRPAFLAPAPGSRVSVPASTTCLCATALSVSSFRPASVASRRRATLHGSPARRGRLTMGLFGLGFPEIAVIATIGVFVFGPSKIAEMGKDLGGVAGGVKKASAEFKEAMEQSLEEADRDIEAKRIEKEKSDTKQDPSSTTVVDNSSASATSVDVSSTDV